MKKDLNIVTIVVIFSIVSLMSFILNINRNMFVNNNTNEVNQDKLELSCPKEFDENSVISKFKITIPKNKKWLENLWHAYYDIGINAKVIKSQYKQKFKGNITIYDSKSNVCKLNAEIRISGDLKDHIKIIDHNIISSLDVTLKKGNIFNIIKFKLVFPETRTDANNVIVGTKILSSVGVITPITKLIDAEINGIKQTFLFEENPNKELIERNLLREGLIAETDEGMFWDNEVDVPLFVKPLNKSWAVSNETNLDITFNYLSILNYHMISSFKRFLDLKNFNNEKYLTANFFGFDTSDFNTETQFNFAKYNLLLLSMNGWHGLKQHQRQFYVDNMSKTIYPIYKDGNLNFILPDKSFNLWLDNYHLNGLTLQDQLFIDQTITLLKNIDINKLRDEINNSGLIYSNESLELIVEGLINRLNYFKSIGTIKPDTVTLQQARNYINEFKWPVSFENFELEKSSQELRTCINIINNCAYVPLSDLNVFNKFNNKDLNYRFFTQLNTYQNFLKVDNEKKVLYRFDNVTIELPSTAKIYRNILTNTLKIELLYSDDRILINNSYIKDLTFEVSSKYRSLNDSKIRINKDSLTGCVTIANSILEKFIFKSNNLHCEDSLNVIKSYGSIKELNIINSYQDGFDADYSKLAIQNVIINKTGNDCLDLSSGNYQIYDSELISCSDKAVSIGEKASAKIFNLKVQKAVNGIVVKDSSLLDLTNAMLELDLIEKSQISSYRKKQEFGSSKVIIKDKEYLKKFRTDFQEGTSFVFN